MACKLNSVLRTVIGTILGVGVNTGLAFILSRKEFIFRSSLSTFWIIASCLECGIIPSLAFMSQINLKGTFWVYVIPGLVNVLYVFVMRAYISIPETVIDQARIDGASYLQIFIKLVFPVCKPICAVIALFTATMHWNSWFDAFTLRATVTVITMLPIMLFGILMQKYYIIGIENMIENSRKKD